jgi:hypothetical protein
MISIVRTKNQAIFAVQKNQSEESPENFLLRCSLQKMQETFAMHQSENIQMIYGYHYIMVSTKYYCIRI